MLPTLNLTQFTVEDVGEESTEMLMIIVCRVNLGTVRARITISLVGRWTKFRSVSLVRVATLLLRSWTLVTFMSFQL